MLLVLVLIGSAGCKSKEPEEVKINWTSEKSSSLNKELAVEEDLNIKMYIAQRPSWKVVETGTGLRFYKYVEGNGPVAKPGMIARVKFKISLLDGTLCYETTGTETERFKIDKSDIESGIQEGIKLMREGDKAKLIIPSHLGHGLAGDFDKIPPLSAIVVDLELVALR